MVQEFCLCSAILESLLFGIGVIGTDSVMLHNAVFVLLIHKMATPIKIKIVIFQPSV